MLVAAGVLYIAFLAVQVALDGAFGWPLAEAFGKTPPNAREACPDCGDPAGEGACEAGPCEPLGEAYIRELEERAR